jgi:hypothetical protein
MEEKHEFKGHNATLIVTPQKIIIKYKKLIGSGKGEKEIRIKSLTGIQLKKPGLLTNGYIQFMYSGGKESKSKSVFDAAKDENTIMITAKQYDDFVKAKQLIEEYQNRTEGGSASVSVADELKKFAELKEMGVITEEEFEAKKKQLLGI